jgi:hypothetical protein
MHWLLVLALLSSTTNLKDGSNGSSLNRLAENALRQQIGSANVIRVDVARSGSSRNGGNFDHFNVTLDGFSADRLAGLASRASSSSPSRDTRYPGGQNPDNRYPDSRDPDNRYPDNRYPDGDYSGLRSTPRRNFDLGDIFGGGLPADIGDIGDLGDIGGILGGIFGAGSDGRIGSVRINATNFTYQGVRYDGLEASLGEMKFDWSKALRGDFDIKSVQPGSLRLNIRGDQLGKLLQTRLPSVTDVRLRFSNGTAFVGGKTSAYGLKVPFEVGGRLSIQSNQVLADNIQLSISRLRLPSFVVDELTKGVNPLYDFDPDRRWPLAINLNTASSNNNTLAMQGGIQWLGFNRR